MPTKDQRPTSLLLISQPNTPGQFPIPGTTRETQSINDMMTAEGIKSLLLEDSAATVIRVQEEMKSHSWVHFSCHDIQDASECLKSGVYLHDRRMELLKIMRQRLPNTVSEHAFHSACQTSTEDEKLSDEAVHLAAGMLATGYRGIVAIIR